MFSLIFNWLLLNLYILNKILLTVEMEAFLCRVAIDRAVGDVLPTLTVKKDSSLVVVDELVDSGVGWTEGERCSSFHLEGG